MFNTRFNTYKNYVDRINVSSERTMNIQYGLFWFYTVFNIESTGASKQKVLKKPETKETWGIKRFEYCAHIMYFSPLKHNSDESW